jgi:MraZ protein
VAFRGLYEHSLDSKDRLTVPSRFRAALSDGVVLSKGFDPCVWLHTPEGYDDLSTRFLSPHSPFGSEARRMRRRFHGGSFDEKLDAAGRIRIPKLLLEHAGIRRGLGRSRGGRVRWPPMLTPTSMPARP